MASPRAISTAPRPLLRTSHVSRDLLHEGRKEITLEVPGPLGSAPLPSMWATSRASVLAEQALKEGKRRRRGKKKKVEQNAAQAQVETLLPPVAQRWDPNTYLGRYQQQLFQLISEEPTTFFFFSRKNVIRRLCSRVVVSPIFELCSQFLILAWSMVLSSKPSRGGDHGSERDKYDKANFAILILFSVEMSVRLVAQGLFYSKNAFFRTGFNVLDLVVVVTMWIESFLLKNSWGLSLGPLRLLRLFSVLRIQKWFQGVDTVLLALSRSLRQISVVFLTMLFFFLLYGTLMTQTYQKSMRRRCFTDDTFVELTPMTFCKISEKKLTDNCPSGSHCVELSYNPKGDFAGFDNIGTALLSLWEINSQDGWVEGYLRPLLQSEPSYSYVTWFVMTSDVLFIAIIIVNLFTAVIIDSFGNVRRSKLRSKVEKGAEVADVAAALFDRFRLKKHLSVRHDDDSSDGGSVYSRDSDDISAAAARAARLLGKPPSQAVRASGPTPPPVTAAAPARGQLLRQSAIRVENDDHGDEVRSKSSSDEAESAPPVVVTLGDLSVIPTELRLHKKSPIKDFLRGKIYKGLVLLLILMSTVCLGIHTSDDSPYLRAVLWRIEVALTTFFGLDLVARMYSQRLAVVVRKPLFVMDAVLMVTSIISLSLQTSKPSDPSVLLLRSLRVLSTLRILEQFAALKSLLDTVLLALPLILNILALMLLTIYAFALVGRELFSQRVLNTRYHFDTLGNSIVTLFQVTTRDGWAEAFSQALVGTSSGQNSGLTASETGQATCAILFFTGFFIWSNYVMSNFLVACIFENFSDEFAKMESEVVARQATEAQEARVRATAQKSVKERRLVYQKESLGKGGSPKHAIPVALRKLTRRDSFTSSNVESQSSGGGGVIEGDWASILGEALSGNEADVSEREGDRAMYRRRAIPPEFAQPHEAQLKRKMFSSKFQSMQNIFSSIRQISDEIDGEGRSQVSDETKSTRHSEEQGVMEKGNQSAAPVGIETESMLVLRLARFWFKFQRGCRRVTEDKRFERMMGFVTVISSGLTLLVGPPGREDLYLKQSIINLTDIFFILIFVFEIFMRMFSGARRYFADRWHRIDFVTAVITIVTEIPGANIPGGRVFRTLRMVRLLKIVSANEDMRNVLQAIVDSARTLFYVTILYAVFVACFSIFGREIFGGKFYSCNDSTNIVYPQGKGDCVGSFLTADGILMARSWRNLNGNFDTLPNGFVTLFRCVSLRWVRISFAAMDIGGRDVQPGLETNAFAAVFFVTFIFIGRFFVANLFVAVILAQYNRAQRVANLSPQQRSWVHTLKRTLPKHFFGLKINEPVSKNRRGVFKVLQRKSGERFSFWLIVSNTFAMSMYHADMSDLWTRTLSLVDGGFALLFAFEFLAKLFALGFPQWVSKKWYIFEGFIAVGSVVSVGLNELKFSVGEDSGRFFRILRILRLINFSENLKHLVWTLRSSALPMANVVLLGMIFSTVFAVVGVSEFGNTRAGRYMSQNDFSNFPAAATTLFRIASSDHWDYFMEDAGVRYPECTRDIPDQKIFGDCGSEASAAYFVVYVVVTTFVLLNLLSAVIINHFSSYYKRQRDFPVVTVENLNKFEMAFNALDPDMTGSIRLSQLWQLFDNKDRNKSVELVLDPRIEAPFSLRLWQQKYKTQFVRYVRAELLLRIYKRRLTPEQREAGRELTTYLQAYYGGEGEDTSLSQSDFNSVTTTHLHSQGSSGTLHSKLESSKYFTRALTSVRSLSGTTHQNSHSAQSVINYISLVRRQALAQWAAVKVRLFKKEVRLKKKTEKRRRKVFRVDGVAEATKESRRRRDRIVEKLQRMEMILSNLDRGAASVTVSYKDVLTVALHWVIDHTFFPPAVTANRRDVAIAIKAHVHSISFFSKLRLGVENSRARQREAARLKRRQLIMGDTSDVGTVASNADTSAVDSDDSDEVGDIVLYERDPRRSPHLSPGIPSDFSSVSSPTFVLMWNQMERDRVDQARLRELQKLKKARRPDLLGGVLNVKNENGKSVVTATLEGRDVNEVAVVARAATTGIVSPSAGNTGFEIRPETFEAARGVVDTVHESNDESDSGSDEEQDGVGDLPEPHREILRRIDRLRHQLTPLPPSGFKFDERIQNIRSALERPSARELELPTDEPDWDLY